MNYMRKFFPYLHHNVPWISSFAYHGASINRSRVAIHFIHAATSVTLVYLDCDDETMLRRFTETRRRHPLSGSGTARDGVAEERELLAPLMAEADRVLDTSLMTPGELKRWVAGDGSYARRADSLP